MKVNTKDVDIGLLRQRKKRRRQLLKFTAFMLVVGIAVLLYVRRDSWVPGLEGIGTRFQSVKSSSGKLAGGNFPLNISGGIDYQTKELNGSLAILSDAYLYIYTDNGALSEERQHAYSNAVLQTAGKKALIYESGGTKFRVENRSKVLYSKKLENSIIFARMNENGTTAVITDSDTYICKMTVYDDSGNEIYSRNCVERVTDLSFGKSPGSCVLATCDAVNGNICSKLVSVSFDSKSDNWVSEEIQTMGVRVYMDSGDIFLLGDTKCAYYDKSGKLVSEYEYPARLKDWDYSGGRAAVLFENETKRRSYIAVLEGGGRTPEIREFGDNNARCIRLIKNHICLLGKDGIMQYDLSGGGDKQISGEGAYDKMLYMNGRLFLLGYDRIDRIDYKG